MTVPSSPVAATAATIGPAWLRVATQPVMCDWEWNVPFSERLLIEDARAAGAVLTAIQRQPDGALWLLARSARGRGG